MRPQLLLVVLAVLACHEAPTNPTVVQAGNLDPKNFSGYPWRVKSALDVPVVGGPNYYSDTPENVFLDAQGRLHLKITERNGKWYSAELVGQKHFGYGAYNFYIDSPLDDLDPNVVFGVFVWGSDPAFAHRELDIEYSVWSSKTRPNAQFVIQPGHAFYFSQPGGYEKTLQSFRWTPSQVSFQSASLAGETLAGHTFTENVPTPLDETVRIILWQFQGQAPNRRLPVEVIVNRFEFVPE